MVHFSLRDRYHKHLTNHGRELCHDGHLKGVSLPAESTLDVNIRVTQPLNITAFTAQQNVTQYVM